MIRNIVCFCIIILLFSCGTKVKEPPGILKPDKMEAVLWDVLRAQAFTVEFIKKDTTKNDVEENLKLQQEIFAIHRISKEEFYRSFEYYKTNNGQMKVIMDTIVNRADRVKDLKKAPIVAQ